MTDACQLYLITPPQIPDLEAFCAQFEAALSAGDIACAQLRLKAVDGSGVPQDVITDAAEALLPIARAHDVAFLINDSPALAAATGADGVHLGQSDAAYDTARSLLGEEATIGVTCHNSKHLALVAGEAGADYVAFGAFFPTQTKDTPHLATPDILEWWRFATVVPSVAIGGVTPQNCAALVRAGADFLAVSSAIWGHSQGPAAAVEDFEAAIAAA